MDKFLNGLRRVKRYYNLNIKERDNSLESGERLVAENLEGIMAGHKVRYELAVHDAKKADRILDIACGVGHGTYLMATQNNEGFFLGVDISKESIDYAKKHYHHKNIQFTAGDESILKNEKAFDLIVCYETIEHIKDDESFVAMLSSKLKRGGKLYLSTPNKEVVSVVDGNHFHFRHYEYKSLVKMMQYVGLRCIKSMCQTSDEDYEIRTGNDGMYFVMVFDKL